MRIFLVTGGSKGIGREIVKRLIKEGRNVIYTYSTESKEEEIIKYLKGNTYCCGYLVNQSEHKQIIEFCDKLKKQKIEIEGAVLNAGISANGLLFNLDMDSWNKVIDTNLTGNYIWMTQLSNIFIKQGYGSLITIASKAGMEGQIGAAAYAASKGGVIALAKTFGKEMSRFGIKNYIIAPGFVDTSMLKGVNREKICKKNLLNRIGTVEEIADFIFYLISNNTYFQNNIFEIDGGSI